MTNKETAAVNLQTPHSNRPPLFVINAKQATPSPFLSNNKKKKQSKNGNNTSLSASSHVILIRFGSCAPSFFFFGRACAFERAMLESAKRTSKMKKKIQDKGKGEGLLQCPEVEED